MRESPHAKQLAAGFRWLRFEGALEAPFRQWHLERVRTRVVVCIAMSIAFSFFAAMSNREVADVATPLADPSIYDSLRVFVIRPLSLLLLAMAFVPVLYRRMWLLGTPIILAVTGSIGAIGTANYVADGNLHAFIGMVSGFLGVFLLVGMLFWHTLVVALVINASYFASMIYAGVPADIMQFEVITLVALSTIALVFVYYLEHSQRETFLQRQVLRDLSERDALTGLRNRGAFDTAFDERWRQALRDRQQIGLLVIDVDHFKAYNDHYGHQAGDRCLEAVGRILERPERRPLDLAARIGGEEFAVLLYGATQPHVTQVAEQLLRAVRLAEIAHARSPVSDRVTVSIGAGVIRPTVGRTPAGLMQYVDEALYLAKRGGRDRIVFPDKSYETLVTGSFKVEQETGAES